jgi:hypothetical protein
MRFIIGISTAAVCLSAAAYASAQLDPGHRPLSATPSTHAATTPQPDSMVWERYPKGPVPVATAHHVPLRMFKVVGPGALFDTLLTRMQKDGFFDLSPAQIVDACGSSEMTDSRWSIRVRDNGAWRELLVPDGCVPSSAALAGQLAGLRSTGRELLFSDRLTRKKP